MDKQQALKEWMKNNFPKGCSKVSVLKGSRSFLGGWEAHEAQSPTDAVALIEALKKIENICEHEDYGDTHENCPVCIAHFAIDNYKLFNPSGAAPAFKCPSCGKPWDTEKHKAFECGAIISTGAAPQVGDKK